MFEKGNTHGKGRPKGSRNKFSQEFIDALAANFSEHGQGVIEVLRTEDPATYVRICASLVPKDFQISGPDGGPLFTEIILTSVKAEPNVSPKQGDEVPNNTSA